MGSDQLQAAGPKSSGQATSHESKPQPGDSTHLPTGKPPLRVALLLDGFEQPEWAARAIADLTASTSVEIAVVILNDSPLTPKLRFARPRAWVRNRNYLLYALYRRLDRWWFGVPDDPFAPANVGPTLKGVPVVRVRPRMTKHCDFFEPDDIEVIRAFDLDVGVRFGFRILKGDALKIARYGVWSYHHGDNLVNRGGPAGFWEVMEGADVTGSVLQRLTEHLDDGHVLYRSFSSTNKYSVAKNQVGVYWTSSQLLRRVVEDLHSNGPANLTLDNNDENVWRGYSNRLYVTPKNAQMARLILRLGRRYLAAKLRESFAFEQWFVAYGIRRDVPPQRFVPDTSYYRFRPLIPPPDRFWADPFPVEHDGRRFIFVEELVYRTRRGRIAVFEIDGAGVAHGPTPALERDYHLSYPFVMEWNGSHYMIPETSANGQIELFRAESFPNKWIFDRVLVANVRAVDATVAEINGLWWMFATVASGPEMPWEELSIFYAESLLGTWTPHRRNPVKSDARNSRPAGRLFEWNGKLYRPAQDCSRRYGHSIVINEVKQIDPDTFRETEVSRVTPGWTKNLLATHTLNADGRLTAIDGLMSRRRGFR